MDKPPGKDFKPTNVDVPSPHSPAENLDLQVDPDWLAALGLSYDIAPQSRAFRHWRPDPWTIVATDDTPLCSLSEITLSIVKAQVISSPEVVITYLFSANTKSLGWSIPQVVPTNGYCKFVLEFLDADRGVLWGVDVSFEMICGTDRNQFRGGRILLDVFDLIKHARVRVAEQWFHPC